jgi:hypothetical protein
MKRSRVRRSRLRPDLEGVAMHLEEGCSIYLCFVTTKKRAQAGRDEVLAVLRDHGEVIQDGVDRMPYFQTTLLRQRLLSRKWRAAHVTRRREQPGAEPS